MIYYNHKKEKEIKIMTTIKFYVIKHVAAEDYRTFLRTRPGDDPSYEVYTSYID